MIDMALAAVIALLVVMVLAHFNRWGWVWLQYKLTYLKRVGYQLFGRCHKCGQPLSYTTKGRPVCTNGDCR